MYLEIRPPARYFYHAPPFPLLIVMAAWGVTGSRIITFSVAPNLLGQKRSCQYTVLISQLSHSIVAEYGCDLVTRGRRRTRWLVSLDPVSQDLDCQALITLRCGTIPVLVNRHMKQQLQPHCSSHGSFLLQPCHSYYLLPSDIGHDPAGVGGWIRTGCEGPRPFRPMLL